MLDSKPTIVLSHSFGYLEKVANPVASSLTDHGFRVVIVGEEPLPPDITSNPQAKVDWFFRHADMAVFLATPDDRLESGEVHTRPNIIDEHRLGLQMPHLESRLMVFKHEDVTLPSNINPVHERLPIDEPQWVVEKILVQAGAWGVLPAYLQQQPTSRPDAPAGQTSALAPDDPVNDDATQQALRALEAAAAGVQGQPLAVDAVDRVEVALAGMLGHRSEHDLLDVHLVNRLFARRDDLRLQPNERTALIRAYLGHADADNTPGIYWLSALASNDAVTLLTELATRDTSEAVRLQALKLLERLGLPIGDAAEQVALSFLSEEESRLRRAGIAFVTSQGRKLRALLDDQRLAELEPLASEAAATVDARASPTAALSQYVEHEWARTDSVAEAISSSRRRPADAAIRTALASPEPKVRGFGLSLVRSPSKATVLTLRSIAEFDSRRRLRIRAVNALIDAGVHCEPALTDAALRRNESDVDEFGLIDLERQLSVRVAVERNDRDPIDWINGAPRYEARGLSDPAWAKRFVRSDLRNGFLRLKEAALARHEQDARSHLKTKASRPLTSDAALATSIKESFDADWMEGGKVGDYVLSQFQVAALRILVAHPNPRDISFARSVPADASSDLRVAALSLFELHGTAHDVPALLASLGSLYDQDARERTADLAFRLAYKKDKSNVLERLRVETGLAVWATQRLAELPRGPYEAADLLDDDRHAVRLAAAQVVWDALRPGSRFDFLAFYLSRKHYYNVVRFFDEKLFLPDWMLKRGWESSTNS